MLGIRFRNIIGSRKVLEAKINPETSEVLCPICNESNFITFRRDKISEEIYLVHCKCENCSQLFIYNVDKKNKPILERDKNGI